MSHPIENIMQTSMEELKQIVDVNTVVGKPVVAGNNAVILPISKVSLGFLSGGGEYGQCGQPIKRCGDMLDAAPQNHPFGGAAVAGMSLTPMGFLYVHDESVRLLSTTYPSALERIMDAVPQALQIVDGLTKKEKNGNAAPNGSTMGKVENAENEA